MSDDLIIKYFQEDLTDAEEHKLSEILASSPEEAHRFFLHAEAAYRNYGLPEPRRPKAGGGPGLLGIPWTSGLLLLFLASGVAWSGWKLVMTWGQNSPAAASQVAQDPSSESQARLSGKNHALRPEQNIGTEMPEAAPESPDLQADAKRSQPVVLPTLAPVPVTNEDRKTHSNLEVVLHRKNAGRVLVRVLGPNGLPMVLLYEGRLEPGSWAFDWNGQGQDGRAASPGTYRIQVVSGSVTQTKNVTIRGK